MITWYAAHTIEYAKFNDEVQDTYSVYENVILIAAESIEVALHEAERIARAEADVSEVIVNGRPARIAFAGIRKLIECKDTVTADFERKNEPFHPMHGTELTYSSFTVETAEAFQKLCQGEATLVWYES